jgi:hypothetical protein
MLKKFLLSDTKLSRPLRLERGTPLTSPTIICEEVDLIRAWNDYTALNPIEGSAMPKPSKVTMEKSFCDQHSTTRDQTIAVKPGLRELCGHGCGCCCDEAMLKEWAIRKMIVPRHSIIPHGWTHQINSVQYTSSVQHPPQIVNPCLIVR